MQSNSKKSVSTSFCNNLWFLPIVFARFNA
nr:MAG TPA: hypothetical protein [Caudoviricetes sp.]